MMAWSKTSTCLHLASLSLNSSCDGLNSYGTVQLFLLSQAVPSRRQQRERGAPEKRLSLQAELACRHPCLSGANLFPDAHRAL